MKYQAGQSLIEVLIAFAVTVVIGVGLISASLVTQRAATSARNNAQATKLAQQYVEQIRIIRDVRGYNYINTFNPACYRIETYGNLDPSAWTFQLVTVTNACSASLDNGEVVNIPEFKATFYRDFDLSADSLGKRTVTVTVSWFEGVNTRLVELESTISNWPTN
ncbi:MAG: hypothetical protein UU23_C0001G0060 [Candidatus Curtissbacteria bacterium GW2011_GWA1_40_9]|uniref:Type II secretion system protein n=1 Tax=Candidatus Curtissbacteria bacterium GW2011_GWA1_40_9 TaxID=1618408 RepID=A0A0G0TTZ8_9BACT|nr:MAG: hypothetical protein UU23_C0001G0060 [Candidatus Curtissbacteria bacterium GW2011_GWA1_40_9]